MTINVQFSARPDSWDYFREPLKTAFAGHGLNVALSRDHDPASVEYVVYAPQSGPQMDFRIFPNLRAVLGLWAGVERIVNNATLQVPLARMVDSGLQEGMVEWVTGHTLRYHLNMDAQITDQNGVWDRVYPPLARHRQIGILGLGALGGACASALAALNFQVTGWSRSQKTLDNIRCLSGRDGLDEVLKTSEILVLLLPLTADTDRVIDARALALMPKGSHILNPGRGALIDDDALIASLDSSHIAHATLDVFRVEPLPADHFFWHHPKVTVTPHLASETRADTAAAVIADNIQRHEAGQKMKFLVNRKSGY
ncbi:MAG: glyoxylate/hydroxypyruvate reductase A [Paracoccaceae bacterium]